MLKQMFAKSFTGSGTGAYPTKERHQRNGGLIWETVPGNDYPGQLVRRYRALWECPLDICRDFGVISREEYRAGMLFHRAYYGVVLLRRRDFRPVSMEHALWPRTGVENALGAACEIIRPENLDAVIEICGHSKPARNLRALTCLKRGLGNLVNEWHLAAREVCDYKRR